MDFYWCPVDEIFAGGVRLTHKVLRALAVDAEQLPPGEILSSELARFAHHRLDCPQAIVKIGRIQTTTTLSPP